MTQRDRIGVEQEFTCWSSDNGLCRGTELAPLGIYPLLSICSSSKDCFFWQSWIQVLLIWQAQLELLILTETSYLGKTENAFLSPSSQSLVKRKASTLHPLIHQESVLAAPPVPQGETFFSTRCCVFPTVWKSEAVSGTADLWVTWVEGYEMEMLTTTCSRTGDGP